MSLEELYAQVRVRFPQIAAAADRHEQAIRSFEPAEVYFWFHSLADALNDEMRQGVDPQVHAELLRHLAGALQSSPEIYQCLDVSFTENLFWQVPAGKASPYWDQMPSELKTLYFEFHHRTPLQSWVPAAGFSYPGSDAD